MTYPDHHPAAFTGTQRFEVIDQLGAGSMCVVYRARDRKHDEVVALKTLRHLDSNSLYRLKQEFRALSNFDHPNLVSFSELVYSDQGWFVTMELIEGTDFLTYCRGPEEGRGGSESSVHGSTWSTQPDLLARPPGQAEPPPLPTDRGLPDLVRLRSSMRQLAEGVQTLHAAGRVHRDLKPSNVLVTEAGRVVILDFGLVAEIDQDYTEGTLHQNIAGSAAYMSPEQSVGRPLSEASDWYSVGVMLYEALTGCWPYRGHLYQILTLKQEEDPPPPSSLVADVPPDLEALCMALLARDPTKRPGGADVLAQFHGVRPKRVQKLNNRPKFRFRNPELHAMTSAFQQCKRGEAGVLLVRGPRGIGKTTLVREFVKTAKRRDPVTILKSHCFEWETLPYKAIDGLMDNLSRALRRRDHRDIAQLANPGVPYLAHLFPVLERVDALGVTEPADLRRLDEVQLRQRAFEGLLQLLHELAQREPLLLFFDDAQWGDEESAAVLAEMLRFSRDVPLLLILAYRTDTRSPFVTRLLGPIEQQGLRAQALDLPALTREQACAMAAEMLGVEPTDARVAQVAERSGGVPAFVHELVRQVAFHEGRASAGDAPLSEQAVRAIDELPNSARRLLFALALCAQPLPDDVALFAAELTGDAFQAVSTLRAHQLVSVTGALGGDTLEIGSERVRDYVLDQIPDDARARFHGRIATTMESRGGMTPEQLVHHYAGAQDLQKAGVVAWLAAEPMVREGREHEAIWLLERALEFGTWSPHERRTISMRMAEALSRIGAGREAARAFREAAVDAAPPRATHLELLAAGELLGSGAADEGLQAIQTLLDATGVRADGGWFGGLQRFRMRWRGLDFTPRDEAAVEPAQLQAIDALWTRATGLALYDVARAARVHQRHLQLALEVGETERALRALAEDVRHRAWAADTGWRERYDAVYAQAQQRGSRAAVARVTAAAADGFVLLGDWLEAARYATSAEQMMAHNRAGAAWERARLRLLACTAHLHAGDLGRVAELHEPMARQLDQIHNPLLRAMSTAGPSAWAAMVTDDPVSALEALAAVDPGLLATVSIPFAAVFVAWCQLELYRGRTAAARSYMDDRWDATAAGLGTMPPVLAADVWLTRARVTLAAAHEAEDAQPLVRQATAALQGAEQVGCAWTSPWHELLSLGLARAQGEAAPVSDALVESFARSGNGLGAAVAAMLRDGRPGAWFEQHQIRQPDRFVAAFAPLGGG